MLCKILLAKCILPVYTPVFGNQYLQPGLQIVESWTLFKGLYAYVVKSERNHLAALIERVVIVAGIVPTCLWRSNLESCQEFE